MSGTVAVLCTRMKSSRLPEKALKLLAGKPVLQHCLDRLKKIGVPVILAYPPIEAQVFSRFFEPGNVEGFAGNAWSPLHRTADAVKALYPEAKYIIRATHDDPLIDADVASALLANARSSRAGYGVSRGLVDGGGVEVIARENLDWAAERYKENGEYISYYVKCPGAPNQVRGDIQAPDELSRPFRLTVDYPADWILLDAILSELGPDASLVQVCAFLDRNPELAKSNSLPLVSFYTCAYNAKRFIGDTIRSVMNSTNLPSEYVIIDDGSNDGTSLEVLKWIGRLGNPPEIRYIRETENKGLASRSNQAVELTRGKYVMRVDADDILVPGSVDIVVNLAELRGADAVYSHYSEIDEAGNPINGRKVNVARHAGCALMRRSFIFETRFRDGIRLGDSKELWDRVVDQATVVDYPQVAWQYRKHGGSLTARATV